MSTTSTQGKLHAVESETPAEHIIFQICLKCHYNTLKVSDCAQISICGPGYRCPSCQKSSFVAACSICRFESSTECPLNLLLTKRYSKGASQERRGRERIRQGTRSEGIGCELGGSLANQRPDICQSGTFDVFDAPDMKKQCQDILKRFKSNGGKIHTGRGKKTQQDEALISPKALRPRSSPLPIKRVPERALKRTTSPQPPATPKEAHAAVEKSPVFCLQCSQARCFSCKPGYMNLVVDMKEFSTTFASGMALCTMCEHWLCPGSSLVVLYRCRDCGHEGCDECVTNEDSMGDEWVDCCRCEKEVIIRNGSDSEAPRSRGTV